MRKTKLNVMILVSCFACSLVLASASAYSGPVDPDCTAEKAAKSAAMKATVGVGGRCSPKETAADTARDAVDIDEKGPIEKKRKNEGTAKKAAKKAVD